MLNDWQRLNAQRPWEVLHLPMKLDECERAAPDERGPQGIDVRFFVCFKRKLGQIGRVFGWTEYYVWWVVKVGNWLDMVHLCRGLWEEVQGRLGYIFVIYSELTLPAITQLLMINYMQNRVMKCHVLTLLINHVNTPRYLD